MIRQLHLAGSALVVVLFISGVAAAQERDPTGSYDTRDVLDLLPHDISELPTRAEAEGRAITFNGSLAGNYTTNAGTSESDPVDTGFLALGIGFDVTPVSLGGWDIGGGALIDGDYYVGDYNDDFGEGRIEGFSFAQHGLGPGALTAEVILLGIYSNDFSEHDLDLVIGDLTYSVSRGGFSAEIGVDYQHSDVAEVRRTRLSATVGYTLPEPQLGYEITFEGDIAFSNYNAGENSSRNDTVAAVTLMAEREFGAWSLMWEAGLVNRFSNRESAEFTAFDLVLELARDF